MGDSPELDKHKALALKGITELEEYQKAHPSIEHKTSQVVIQSWVKRAKGAGGVSEIEALKDEIFEEAGYDILENDDEEDFFENLDDSNQSPAQLDEFSGIQIADATKSPKKSSKKEDDDEYSDDFGDDFDF